MASEETSGEGQSSGNSLTHRLEVKSPILGLRLYAVIGIFGACFIASAIAILWCLIRTRKERGGGVRGRPGSGRIPLVSKDIGEIKASDLAKNAARRELEEIAVSEEGCKRLDDHVKVAVVEGGDDRAAEEDPGAKRSAESGMSGASGGSSSSAAPMLSPRAPVDDIGWGRWFSLQELDIATGGFVPENVIGEGGYGIVYRGALQGGPVVAVKKLLNNKSQAEKEFEVEVEAIGKVRHKNLVGLLGFCAEGANRMLVYEYVDNGNLEEWLHGDVGPVSPLTWDIRMKIAIGTAKGLTYLHEGLEPKVVHRDVKSSNILLDKHWNAKVSDFGLAKLLGSEASYVTTRVMGTFGYVSPEYASTGMLNEGNDVYSFGVLLMEIISGRSPVDYSRPAEEMNLVDWFRGMIASHRSEGMVDPLIDVPPSPRALKRALLVCLRCIDHDSSKRPRMGQIVHMLEGDEFPYRTERKQSMTMRNL